jgi:hypothetical protein
VDTVSPPDVGGPSPRVRLAQLARETALGTPGVVDLDAGPTGMFCTVGAGHRIGGVTCSTAPEGGFDLSLRLVCELVPLYAVADRVRAGIEAAATEAGAVGQPLVVQSVTILIADLAEAG